VVILAYSWSWRNAHTCLHVCDLEIVCCRDILHVCSQDVWIQESGWKSLT